MFYVLLTWSSNQTLVQETMECPIIVTLVQVVIAVEYFLRE